jgi:hypothetical protein
MLTFKAPSHYLSGWSEENREKPQSRYAVAQHRGSNRAASNTNRELSVKKTSYVAARFESPQDAGRKPNLGESHMRQ